MLNTVCEYVIFDYSSFISVGGGLVVAYDNILISVKLLRWAHKCWYLYRPANQRNDMCII